MGRVDTSQGPVNSLASGVNVQLSWTNRIQGDIIISYFTICTSILRVFFGGDKEIPLESRQLRASRH